MKRNNEDFDIKVNKKLKNEKILSYFDASVIRPDSVFRLKSDFFNQNCLDLSKKLIGKYLIRQTENQNTPLVGKIVEVEAYTGTDDAASHSFKKQTDRNKAMFMNAGTAYVYNIYGCYCCFNISSKELGAAVLIRALEPIYGIDQMRNNKKLVSKGKDKSNINDKKLTNGPSKLCMCFNITKISFDQVDLANSQNIWLQDKIHSDSKLENSRVKIVSAKRINIDYAGQNSANKMWRFYIKDNKYVSIVSKESVELD